MNYTQQNISEIIEAQVLGETKKLKINSVSIDSRSLQNGENTLFFAISGPNHNGHQYIEELIKNGVKAFVVSEIPENLDKKAVFFKVSNTIEALQKFAAYHRSQFSFPVIGITGSNGKTIIKEWLSFLLNPDFNIIRNPKSYNSQIGVPLSVLAIDIKNNFGIFEAGISTRDEMQKLETIIQPTIGILSNIGSAHDEGFDNIGEKIKEKLKLFCGVSILILEKNKTTEAFLKPTTPKFTWSLKDKTADVFIRKKTVLDKTLLEFKVQTSKFEIKIPFQDDASIENTIQCVMILLYLEYDYTTIENRVALLYPVEMRLKLKAGINNTTIIDDSYSSDFQSLKIALDFLENQKQFKKKTVILSDIFQSGLDENELYSNVSQLIITNKINRVIGIGETISKFKKKFMNVVIYKTTDEFVADYQNLNFNNETILVKGARSFEFEKIVAKLEEKNHETVLEINLNAISQNLNFFKSKLNSTTKMMVMLKAFGYGNGSFEIAKLLEHHKVDYLGVAFADEGISLKNAGIKLPIMVLNPESTSFSSMLEYTLEPEIYSLKGLDAFLKFAEQKKVKNFPIHIKIDTGMHRLGFQEKDIVALISKLKATDSVQIKSILSHLAASDDEKFKAFTHSQIEQFDSICNSITTELKINPIRHILNTSGISNFPEAQYEMVRLGIGIYGVSNNEEEQKQLANVSTLKSIISQIRIIEKGESVGYSRRFIAEKTSKIATIPIGYADGIDRHLGNGNGYVLINNQKAIIIGSICMDMLMVDVSEIDCQEGNEVVIFGKDLTLNEIAKKLDTIPYEIMTSISQRVKRVFYRE